jgi:hypothetical protein
LIFASDLLQPISDEFGNLGLVAAVDAPGDDRGGNLRQTSETLHRVVGEPNAVRKAERVVNHQFPGVKGRVPFSIPCVIDLGDYIGECPALGKCGWGGMGVEMS